MHFLTLQLYKIKKVVISVHVMHERCPANYSTSEWCSPSLLQVILVHKLMHQQLWFFVRWKWCRTVQWKKKMKISRFNSFTSLLLLSPCWSKQNTVNHLFFACKKFLREPHCREYFSPEQVLKCDIWNVSGILFSRKSKSWLRNEPVYFQ